jgi:hypothetical protein
VAGVGGDTDTVCGALGEAATGCCERVEGTAGAPKVSLWFSSGSSDSSPGETGPRICISARGSSVGAEGNTGAATDGAAGGIFTGGLPVFANGAGAVALVGP